MACRTIDNVSRSPAEIATPKGLATPACASSRGFGFGMIIAMLHLRGRRGPTDRHPVATTVKASLSIGILGQF
jgi:hypothetical protein